MMGVAAVLGGIPGCDSGPAGRFVVLVVMDTARRDAFGCYGHPGNPTPWVDSLAVDGARFDRAVSTSGWTLPAVASLLTGTWPTIHGALGRSTTLSPLRAEVPTAAEVMRAAGYRTAAWANAAFVSPQLGIDRGFERFDHVYAFNEDSRRADETVDAAIEYVREHRRDDCFILVHLFDPHLDYDPPGELATRFTGGRNDPAPPLSIEDCLDMERDDETPAQADIDYVRGVYQGEVAFLDRHLGRLVRELDDVGAYDRSLIVITADHGEEFWDHGGFEHGHTLYDELVRVPLVVKFPAEFTPSVREVTWQVRLIDVMPTVFDYLRIDAPGSFEGETLIPYVRAMPQGHRDAFSESLLYGTRRVAWRSGGFTYIQDIEDGRDEVGELYAWSDTTGGMRELSGEMPEIASRLRAECMAFYLGLLERARGMSDLTTVKMSPEEVDKLRSLGYIR